MIKSDVQYIEKKVTWFEEIPGLWRGINPTLVWKILIFCFMGAMTPRVWTAIMKILLLLATTVNSKLLGNGKKLANFKVWHEIGDIQIYFFLKQCMKNKCVHIPRPSSSQVRKCFLFTSSLVVLAKTAVQSPSRQILTPYS